MRLKTTFFWISSLLYITLIFFVWIYSDYLNQKINGNWAKKFVEKQVQFDKTKTLFPIIREINIVQPLTKNQNILEMIKYESNPKMLKNGLETLEKYKAKFQDNSYFIAIAKSKNYYFNDSNDTYLNNPLRYQLKMQNKDDKWFFDALKLKDNYQINVNKDNILGKTKVWINYFIKENNETIAIVGTGFELNSFLAQTVSFNQDGIKNIFVNKDSAIQLYEDAKLIDFASFTKNKNEINSLDLIIKDPLEANTIKKIIASNTFKNNEIKTLRIKIDNQDVLVGIAPIPEINWYSISIIDDQELFLMSNISIFIILGILFIIFIILHIKTYKRFIIKPLLAEINLKHQETIALEQENQNKDELLSLQRRFEATAHALENILHQFKIPLSRAGSLMLEIEALTYTNKDRKSMVDIQHTIDKLRDHIMEMNGTIEDFHKLYNNKASIVQFNANQLIENIWQMLNAKAIMLNITLETKLIENIKITNFYACISHLLFISFDYLLNQKNKINCNIETIFITINNFEEFLEFQIFTNSIELQKDIIHDFKALEPAFLITKEQLNGTFKVEYLDNKIQLSIKIPKNL